MGEEWIRETKKGIVKIRLAVESDNGEIRRFYDSGLFELGGADKGLMILDKHDHSLWKGAIVAEYNGHLIGFTKYWKDASKGEDFYYFHRAVVEPEFRREKLYTAFFLLRMKYSGGRHFEATPDEAEAKAVRPAVEKIAEKLGLTLEITPEKKLIVHVSSNINLQELENKIGAFLNALGWVKHG